MSARSFTRADTPAAPRRAKNPADCATCAALCCRLLVVLDPEDNIPEHLTTHLPVGLHVMARDETGWCVAMDRTHMNCGIYEHRPAVCRRFVMGGAYCNAIRAEHKKSDNKIARSIPITLK